MIHHNTNLLLSGFKSRLCGQFGFEFSRVRISVQPLSILCGTEPGSGLTRSLYIAVLSIIFLLEFRQWSSANCPLQKPCEACETLPNEKPICETLRKFCLRKLAKTFICKTLRILRNNRKNAKLVFAKPCETRICETCYTSFAKLGETLRNTTCKNRESCKN